MRGSVKSDGLLHTLTYLPNEDHAERSVENTSLITAGND